MAEKTVAGDGGKTIRAGSDERLAADVQEHAREAHPMTLTRDRVLAMAEVA